MKLFIAGVRRGYGVGKESKKSYDMNTAFCLEPIKPGSMGAMTIEGHGFEMIEMPLAGADVVEKFRNVRLPAVVEVVIETRPLFGKYASTITDVVIAPNQKAA